jgi:regulator of sigma E protease
MFILIFLLTLLTLVLIHEFGHFLACKKFNIKVLEFGFGLPPRVWGKKIGETLWSLNLLPIGGFVRPLGEDEAEDSDLTKEDKKDWAQRSFQVKPVTQRILVVIAGVVMNLLLAWVLFYIVLIAQNFKIIYPTISPIVQVGAVEDNFPAKDAGLKAGDRILAINNQPVQSPEQVSQTIKTAQGSLTLTVSDLEAKTSQDLMLTPREVSPGEKRIGIVFSPFPFKQYNTLPEKIFSGITYSFDVTKLTFMGLGKLFSDLGGRQFEQASQSVAGPVGMVVITKNIVSLGGEAVFLYLWFVAIMSLTLAIFNVLPIPALDGGRLFFLLVELITGKKTDAKFEKTVHTIGMVVLLSLMVLITYSDIKKFF